MRTREQAEMHSLLPLRKWFVQMCSAVETLRRYGVAHRCVRTRSTAPCLAHAARCVGAHSDIKLENFVLRGIDSVCLIDFGVSLAFGERDALAAAAGGSTFYLPPEAFGSTASSRKTQRSERLSFGQRRESTLRPTLCTRASAMASDLWALGVVLLETTSGHVFQTRKDRSMLGRIASDLVDAGGDATARWRQQLALYAVDVSVRRRRCSLLVAVADGARAPVSTSQFSR